MNSSRILRPLISGLLALALMLPMTVSCTKNPSLPDDGRTDAATTTVAVTKKPSSVVLGTPNTPAVKKLSWADDRVFPTFPKGSGTIDVIRGENVNDEEKIVLTCLEGLVNAHETRFALFVDNVETWSKVYGYKTNVAGSASERYEMIRKYASEVSGVVLYSQKDARTNGDIVNLATTVANIRQGLPMTQALYKRWQQHGIDLPVIEDLTTLEFKNRYSVYDYLYDNYWKDCDKRILFVQNSSYPQMRDLAAATGSAVIYLSCKESDRNEYKLMNRFLSDLTPGKSILVGWNGQEKELMTVAAKNGLSCVPADFFSAPSLFEQEQTVRINAVPDLPELENKIYIAFYFSDGDNIQYNMNAMREYWDNSRSYRGKIPLNWTISPALYDIAPGMMNYYYGSATEKECFVCGPSGMGYTVPVNTFGATLGNAFTNSDYFGAYVDMTNRYLAKTGLRTVTIWDNLTEEQRKIYSSQGSYLYGLTVQHFTKGDLDLGYTGVTNGMLIQQMTPAYFAKNEEGTTKLTELGEIDRAVNYLKYDGTAPVFISVQVSVWAFHDVKEVIDYEKYLSDKYAKIYGEDVVEFVRSDHYFNLYNQANGLPYDLTLRSDLKISASSGGESAALIADGSRNTLWQAEEQGGGSVTLDLAADYEVGELSIFFAEGAGENYRKSDNVAAMTVEISRDGSSWEKLTELTDNDADWVSLTFEAKTGRYLRLTVTDPGASGIARIADVNVNGRAV